MEGKFQSVSPIHASSRLVLLKVEDALESPGDLLKTQVAGPHPRVSGSGDLDQRQESVFLKSSQVMQTRIVQGPHFENHSFSGFHQFHLFMAIQKSYLNTLEKLLSR